MNRIQEHNSSEPSNGAMLSNPINSITAEAPSRRPRRSVFMAMLQQRCPRCLEGMLFKGQFLMNDPCPVCGLVFERDPGYFMGALYFSYALGIVVLVPLFYLFMWLLPDCPVWVVPLLAVVPYLPMTPFIYRMSRVLWLYFDHTESIRERSRASRGKQ